MIQKTIVMKAAAAVIGAAAIAGTVAAVRHMSQVKDSYRSILLYEIEGTAEIEREGRGKFNGTENLYLESGDQLTVEAESFTRLRLDEDKYVVVEENSALSIEAAGTREDSRTKLNLTKGAMINEIRNPLSSGSTYEVTTPNSIMAVRGTIFRVEIYYDENGEMFTKVSVFEGEVSSRLIYPDGTMDEEVMTGNGKEVIIHSNQELTEYLGEARDIRYDELPEDIVDMIREMMNREGTAERNGGEEPVERSGEGLEEPETIKEVNGAEEEKAERISGAEEKTEGSRAGEAMPAGGSSAIPETLTAPEIVTVPETSTVPETAEETSMALTEAGPSGQAEDESSSERGSSDDSGGSGGSRGGGGSEGGGGSGDSQPEERPAEHTTEAPAEPSAESTTEAPTETSEESTGESPIETSEESTGESPTGTSEESTGESPTGTSEESTGESPTETSEESTGESPTETSEESTGEAPDETPEESTAEPPTETPEESTAEEPTEAPTEPSTEAPAEPEEYTVTFMYEGAVFCVQQVEEGQCAAEPWLKPANDGSWDFNFNHPVTENITIQWISGG